MAPAPGGILSDRVALVLIILGSAEALAIGLHLWAIWGQVHWPVIFFPMGAAMVIAAVLVCRGLFAEFNEECGEIFRSAEPDRTPGFGFGDVREGFSLPLWALGLSLIFAFGVTSVYRVAGFLPEEVPPLARQSGDLAIFLAAAMAGIALIILLRVGTGLYRFGLFHRFELPFHDFSVLRLGRLLHRCFLLILLTLLPYQLTGLFVGGVTPSVAALSSEVMLYIGYPVVLFVLAMFVIVQWPYHLRLVRMKRARLGELGRQLAGLEALEQAGQRSNLFAEIDRIQRLPDWPTTTLRFFQAAGTSALIPLLPLLIDKTLFSG
ncbi:MAG: hypothetical protein AAGF44_00970 [Pseudomonadota bacterium]